MKLTKEKKNELAASYAEKYLFSGEKEHVKWWLSQIKSLQPDREEVKKLMKLYGISDSIREAWTPDRRTFEQAEFRLKFPTKEEIAEEAMKYSNENIFEAGVEWLRDYILNQ